MNAREVFLIFLGVLLLYVPLTFFFDGAAPLGITLIIGAVAVCLLEFRNLKKFKAYAWTSVTYAIVLIASGFLFDLYVDVGGASGSATGAAVILACPIWVLGTLLRRREEKKTAGSS